MKKFFSLLFLLLLSSFSNAQNYIPLPDSGGVWINEWQNYYYNGTWVEYYTPYYLSFCTHGEDTIINAQDYFKVDTCQGGYKGAMRNDNGKVWYVPADSASEYLLYDFSVQVGDTVEIYYDWENLEEVIIYAIDSILINGEYHLTINLGGSSNWIEGIGNPQGLFWEPWGNVSNYFIDLFCHSVNGTRLYPQYSAQGCNWQTIGLKEHELSYNMWPNPSSDLLNISFPQLYNGKILLMDQQGKILFEQEIKSNNELMEVSTLSSGTYMILIQTDDNRSVSRFVKL